MNLHVPVEDFDARAARERESGIPLTAEQKAELERKKREEKAKKWKEG